MIEVVVQPHESIDSTLKRFNTKLQQSGVMRQIKENMYYEKPCEKRRRAKRTRRAR